MAHDHDYLAIVLIGGGSSWGRSPDKEKAIENCIRSLRDWDRFYKVSDVDVEINVIDVIGYDEVSWSSNRFHAKKEGSDQWEQVDFPIERIVRHTPKYRRRA